MRTGSSTVNYLLSDHLGGTNVTVTTAGGEFGEVRYKAFGDQRYSSGTTPTTFKFTGQRQEASIGLYFYGARWYDPALGRFIQADSIVSGGVQGNDRYAYTNNNPINFTDPSGHAICDSDGDCGILNSPGMRPKKYDPVELTHSGEAGGYDGQDMNDLYQKYKNTTNSWWYDDLGRDADGFTITDFLIVILWFEMMGMGDDDAYTRFAYGYSLSENYSFQCSLYSSTESCGGVSDNATLNYISGLGSAWLQYDEYITGGGDFGPVRDGYIINHTLHPITGEYNWNLGVAKDIVLDALSSLSSYGSQVVTGNDTMFPVARRTDMAAAMFGFASDQVLWSSPDNKAYIVTPGQYNYWQE